MFTLHIVDCVVFYSERLDVEKIRDGRPLCMAQYKDILSCCRIPGKNVDTQRRSPIDQSRHMIVAHNGHVSTVDPRLSSPCLSRTRIENDCSIRVF